MSAADVRFWTGESHFPITGCNAHISKNECVRLRGRVCKREREIETREEIKKERTMFAYFKICSSCCNWLVLKVTSLKLHELVSPVCRF
jgi:hypothetical protein